MFLHDLPEHFLFDGNQVLVRHDSNLYPAQILQSLKLIVFYLQKLAGKLKVNGKKSCVFISNAENSKV